MIRSVSSIEYPVSRIMRDASILNLVKNVRPLSPEDTIGRAAEALRASGLTRLPIINSASVVGEITDDLVLKALTSGDPQSVAEEHIGSIMSREVVSLNRHMTIGHAAEIMTDRNLPVMAVLDEYGRYLGFVTRSDITSALCLTIRPPVVAGMATPLGVYLTTGHLRAGAGDLGLILAGVALMLMRYAATGLIFGAAWLIDKTSVLAPWSLVAILTSPSINVPNWMDTLRMVMAAAALPIFLLMMRILPLSGYHAAEHQVVHAIESGEPLKPANVLAMPRVHPRCGTNIVAAIIVFLMVQSIFSAEVAMLIAVFMLVFAWRIIGGFFQYYVTTKPPNARQLASGIKAGESLLEQYRTNAAYHVTGWQRIWNTGLPQVMIGAAAVLAIQELLFPGWSGLF